MAKLFGVIPYGRSGGALGEFVKDVGTVGEGFMGRALATKDAEDAREAAIADAVTKATLTAAVNLDSKYPAFKAAEQTRIKKYEALKNNSAVGPEVAKWAYFQPGFLDNDNYLENAFQYASANPRFKYTGKVEPSEQYQENIMEFQNNVRGKFGDSHGGNMAQLFVGKEEPVNLANQVGQTTTAPDTTIGDSTQTDTTDTDFTTSMMPPMKSKTVSQQKDKIWSTVLGYASQGIQPEQLLANNIITKPEYDIWMSTSGSGDLRLESMKIAMDSNPDLMNGLLSQDEDVIKKSFADIRTITNILTSGKEQLLTNVNMTGGGASEIIDNKTYIPTNTNTPDTGESIYGVKEGDTTQYYVKRNGVFLKVTHENGKTIVEGDKTSNAQKFEEEYKDKPFFPG